MIRAVGRAMRHARWLHAEGTQKQVARRAGISRAALKAAEAGRPSIKALVSLADLYGLTLSAMLVEVT